MTVPALPPGTRPGTGGYTTQLPSAAGTPGQSRRIASVTGKHHVEQWYTPVSQQDITDAVAAVDLTGLATESYVDSAIGDIALPTRDSLGLGTDDSPIFGGLLINPAASTPQIVMRQGAASKWWILDDDAGSFRVRSGNNGASFKFSALSVQMTTGKGFVSGATNSPDQSWRIITSPVNRGNIEFEDTHGVDGRFSYDHGTRTAIINAGNADRFFVRHDNVTQQRNGPNPQELQVYEQYTSDTNRSYLSIKAQTGGDFVIEPVGVGSTLRKLRMNSGNAFTFLDFNPSSSAYPSVFLSGHRGVTVQNQSDSNPLSNITFHLGYGTGGGSGRWIWKNGHLGREIMSLTTSGVLSIRDYATDTLQAQLGESLSMTKGLGAWGTTPPTTQPAAPATLSEAVAVLQAYGLCS